MHMFMYDNSWNAGLQVKSSSFLLSCPGYVLSPPHHQLILQGEQAALSPHTQNTGGEGVKPPFLLFQNPFTDKIFMSLSFHTCKFF